MLSKDELLPGLGFLVNKSSSIRWYNGNVDEESE